MESPVLFIALMVCVFQVSMSSLTSLGSQGYHYVHTATDPTFPPCLHSTVLASRDSSVLLALAAAHGWSIYLTDVEQAFPHGELDDCMSISRLCILVLLTTFSYC